MNANEAKNILKELVQGIDPETGNRLPSGTVLDKPLVMRALLVGIASAEDQAARDTRRAALPKNIGKTWTAEERSQLIDSFQAGTPLEEIASNHGRTVRAIEARLEAIGLITREQRTTSDRGAQ